jgi:hypothetical protein
MIALKRAIPVMALVSDHELGVDQDQSQDGSTDVGAVPKPEIFKPKVKKPA